MNSFVNYYIVVGGRKFSPNWFAGKVPFFSSHACHLLVNLVYHIQNGNLGEKVRRTDTAASRAAMAIISAQETV